MPVTELHIPLPISDIVIEETHFPLKGDHWSYLSDSDARWLMDAAQQFPSIIFSGNLSILGIESKSDFSSSISKHHDWIAHDRRVREWGAFASDVVGLQFLGIRTPISPEERSLVQQKMRYTDTDRLGSFQNAEQLLLLGIEPLIGIDDRKNISLFAKNLDLEKAGIYEIVGLKLLGYDIQLPQQQKEILLYWLSSLRESKNSVAFAISARNVRIALAKKVTISDGQYLFEEDKEDFNFEEEAVPELRLF